MPFEQRPEDRTRARSWEVQTGSELGAPVEKVEKRAQNGYRV